MTVRIPFIRPTMPDAAVLAADFASIAAANWYTNFGPQEQAFRRAISEYLGPPLEVATVSNATVGLMGALAALLPKGDGTAYVATASFTFAAGAQAISWHGYRPAWLDIDPDSLQPSLSSLRELLSTGVELAAILLTNTFGIGAAEISGWEEKAQALGIPLVIDSAAGFGSRYPSGELLGSRGDCEVFSFHATKPFAIGEGGAVVTRKTDLADRVREFTNFGFHARDAGAAHIGLNGKLQEINAAIGLRQLADFEDALADRRALVVRYMREFAGKPLRFPTGVESSSLGFAPIVAESEEARDRVLARLAQAGVEARSYYSPPVHTHAYMRQFEPLVSLECTTEISARMLSLPVLPRMAEDEFQRVGKAIDAALASG